MASQNKRSTHRRNYARFHCMLIRCLSWIFESILISWLNVMSTRTQMGTDGVCVLHTSMYFSDKVLLLYWLTNLMCGLFLWSVSGFIFSTWLLSDVLKASKAMTLYMLLVCMALNCSMHFVLIAVLTRQYIDSLAHALICEWLHLFCMTSRWCSQGPSGIDHHYAPDLCFIPKMDKREISLLSVFVHTVSLLVPDFAISFC